LNRCWLFGVSSASLLSALVEIDPCGLARYLKHFPNSTSLKCVRKQETAREETTNLVGETSIN